MGKSLVIVESPAKAKTINKYLGSEFIVTSSVGHVRDLPSKALGLVPPKRPTKELKQLPEEERLAYLKRYDYDKLVDRMGVDPEHDWKAHYQVLQGKEKVVKELKKLAKDAESIYLATDLDREGEAIAWHLQELLKRSNKQFKRVVFNEITKNAITKAFESPANIDIDRVYAQQARRFLDRIVGFMVSPLLWKKIARGLSAGRVQSVATRLVVEREREIKAFIPEEYWEVNALLKHSEHPEPLGLQVVKHDAEAFRPTSKSATDEHLSRLQRASYVVTSRESKPTQSRPSAPFITSTLQQAASTRLGFGVKKTMMMAQRLYEAGFITYMRTDSTNLSADALHAARDYILKQFGETYLPTSAVIYASKEDAQEAHEAIRPTNVTIKAESLKSMEPDAQRLYDVIWRQFVACQMVNARYDASTIKVTASHDNNHYELVAKGRILKFDGWTRVQKPVGKTADVVLPEVNEGEGLALNELNPTQHFTKPVARFSEASLVKELEKRGIGRPSTYATIISTIQDRGYVRLENKRFYAEKMGEIVTDRLVRNFQDLVSYDFTANMEERLDSIAHGECDWKTVLNEFYEEFVTQLAMAERPFDEGGMLPNESVQTPISCSSCGRPMNLRAGSTGIFLGCSGYNLPPAERCTNTTNLISGDEVVNIDDPEEKEARSLRAKRRCPECDTAMDSYVVSEKLRLHVCGNTPRCHGIVLEEGTYKIKGYDGPVIECDKCSAEMELKTGRFGKYFGCTECKNTRKLLKNGEPAPPKEDPVDLPELKCEQSDAHFVLRDGAAGLFLAASTFPKSRETRAPKVVELVRFKERLADKFKYLAAAPTEDPEGNEAVLKFSRKTKEQYVATLNDKGKPTGWAAYFVDGTWQVQDNRKTK